MVKYTDTKEEAKKIAIEMAKEEPEYAENIEVCETAEELWGLYTSDFRYVIHNETE